MTKNLSVNRFSVPQGMPKNLSVAVTRQRAAQLAAPEHVTELDRELLSNQKASHLIDEKDEIYSEAPPASFTSQLAAHESFFFEQTDEHSVP